MYIENVLIENYRSIKYLPIIINNNFLQIIGENNSGKTNIFRAIELFFKKSTAGINQDDFFQKNINNKIEVKITFYQLNASEKSFFNEYLIDNRITIKKTISLNRETLSPSGIIEINKNIVDIPYYDGNKIIDYTKNKNDINNWIENSGCKEYFQNDKGSLTKKSIEEGIPKFIQDRGNKFTKKSILCKPKYPWTEILEKLPEVLYIEATRKISDEMKTGQKTKSIFNNMLEKIILRSLNDNKNNTDLFNEFSKNLQNVKKHLTKIEGDKDNRFEIIKKIEKDLLENLNENITAKNLEIKIFPPELRELFKNNDIIINDGIEGSIDNKGDGLKRSLIFSLFITYSQYLKDFFNDKETSEKNPFLFLIEEPELFLHPQAQKTLRDALNLISNYDQVFYSTHCSNFIDINNYLSMGLTKKESLKEGTKVVTIE